MRKKKAHGGPKFSTHSQKSLLERGKLQRELASVGLQAKLVTEGIAKAKEAVDSLTNRAANGSGSGMAPIYLRQHLEELERLKLEQANWEKHGKSLQAKIAALENPPASERHARRLNQRILAGLADKRLAKDVAISRAVERLRAMLQDRDGLSFQMRGAAEKIDLDLSESCEPGPGLTYLAAALPGDLAEQSERWTDWFLGRSQDLNRYIICRHPLTLPETLVSPRFYDQQEEVLLTEEEAAPLLARKDSPICEAKEENVPDQTLGRWNGRELVRRAGAVSVVCRSQNV